MSVLATPTLTFCHVARLGRYRTSHSQPGSYHQFLNQGHRLKTRVTLRQSVLDILTQLVTESQAQMLLLAISSIPIAMFLERRRGGIASHVYLSQENSPGNIGCSSF